MENNQERVFEWDDIIVHDGEPWKLMPEGDYDFEVVGFNRIRHPGSAKLPPCNKAELEIRIDSAEGSATMKHNLFLHTKCEGLLCQFFTAIGQRRHGEALKMNWNAVVGAKGRCKVSVRSWKNDNGEEKQNNEIQKFYEPEEAEKPKFTAGAF